MMQIICGSHLPALRPELKTGDRQGPPRGNWGGGRGRRGELPIIFISLILLTYLRTYRYALHAEMPGTAWPRSNLSTLWTFYASLYPVNQPANPQGTKGLKLPSPLGLPLSAPHHIDIAPPYCTVCTVRTSIRYKSNGQRDGARSINSRRNATNPTIHGFPNIALINELF
ncbi:hypothetical protein GGS20DRAFT_435643 [Poronia punctata]|nr:hypothetical protein GGS20DRAFT_435643 [Poronia punctata]